MDEFNPFYGMTKAALDKFGGKVAEKPAESFGHVYDYIVGGFDYYLKKANLRRELDFQQFRDELLDEMSKIPDDNVKEPSMSIIGPALESSKYYIEDDEIRKMFSKLLARSMDDRYTDKLNHSFVEILKQVGPTDAAILKYIASEEFVPTAKITTLSNGIHGVTLTDFFLLLEDKTTESIQISLNNLKRLGLIEIPEYGPLTPSKIYQPFYSSEVYKELSRENYIKDLHDEYQRAIHVLGMNPEKIAFQNGVDPKELETVFKYTGIDIIESRSSLTSYGKALWDVCAID